MAKFLQLSDFSYYLQDVLSLSADGVEILDEKALRETWIDELAWSAVFAEYDAVRDSARWIIWEAAAELGVVSASIQELYEARGREEYKDFVVPAINLRAFTFDCARLIFKSLESIDGGPVLFEIARSEIGYTRQRPAEYVSQILAAAIKEGWHKPVFVQGDHTQIVLKNYKKDPEAELEVVKDLIREEIAGGFYNIDIDTSTLVDLDKETLDGQQNLNYSWCASLTELVREIQPEGVEVSLGGEIGEVGKENSTPEEFEAFMDGYLRELKRVNPNFKGISKISIQTGTSHGGVVLPDGSVAKVAIDFNALKTIGALAREKYGLAGAVQHGASTLPSEAFHHFAEAQTCEVHLATGFQNIIYDHLPEEIRHRIYAFLDRYHSKERKEGWTDDQFYYKTRKKGFGPFKLELWDLDEEAKAPMLEELSKTFLFLFNELKVNGSAKLLDKITPVKVKKPIPKMLKKIL